MTAKMELHKKTEVKEQLTEHLCAIIQQNELRKAHKLEELMQQLQLQTSMEELESLRQQEEEQEKTRNAVESQSDKKEGSGSVSNQEMTVLSIEDCKPAEERSEVGVEGEETEVKTKTPKGEGEDRSVENHVEAERVES